MQTLCFRAQQLANGTGAQVAWHRRGAGVESRQPPRHGFDQAPRRFDMREILPRPRREFSTWLGRPATARDKTTTTGIRRAGGPVPSSRPGQFG